MNSRCLRISALIWITLGLFAGCSSTPEVKQQAYAKLSGHRTFEYEFPVVWKGIEASLKNHKILDRDPETVDALEMKKITKRTLATEWIYGQSRDKYMEYEVNGSPRKKYLQTRFKYDVIAKTTMGGTDVTVETSEEIEKLNEDGSSAGYSSADMPDSSRANELLERIHLAILSAAF